MSAAAEYWERLYAEAEELEATAGGGVEWDDTAALAQGSLLGRWHYYLDGAPAGGERA